MHANTNRSGWLIAATVLGLHVAAIATLAQLTPSPSQPARSIEVALLAPEPPPVTTPSPEPVRTEPAPLPVARQAETPAPKAPTPPPPELKPVVPKPPPARPSVPKPVQSAPVNPVPLDTAERAFPEPQQTQPAAQGQIDSPSPIPAIAPPAIAEASPVTAPDTDRRSTATAGNGPAATGPRADANWSGNTPPPYPPAARRMREEGDVRLAVHIDETGKVIEVRVAQTSGFPRLDMAAIETVKKWRFTPATVDGRPTAGWYENWLWSFRIDQ